MGSLIHGNIDVLKLYDASELSNLSDKNIDVIDLLSVTKAINYSAVTGSKFVIFQRPLSDTVINQIKEKGYIVEESSPKGLYRISWR